MNLELNNEKLFSLLKSFYTITKMRIAIFDIDYKKVMEYPNDNCSYCKIMKSNLYTNKSCEKSDKNGFKICTKSDLLFSYKCENGLIESMINLKINNVVVGFIMFGQISDIKNKTERNIKLLSYLNDFKEDEEEKILAIESLKYKSKEEIEAASILLLALAKYTIHEKLLLISKQEFVSRLNLYINENIQENIEIDDLCSFFDLSRTGLYEMSKKYLKQGLALYIKNQRIEKAYDLILNTDLSISQIASKVGYYDYNYFNRVFKNIKKTSPSKLRKNN